MLRATVTSLLARKLRLVLSALSVVLGVSFVAGALVLTDSIGSTFDSLFSTVSKNVAVVVRPAAPRPSESSLDTDRTVPPSAVAAVRRVDGVAEVAPEITSSALLAGRDGKPVTTSGAPTFGANWVAQSTLSTQRIAEGRPPAGAGEVVIDRDLAAKAGKKVGDEATVFTDTGQLRVRIVGLMQYPDGRGSLGGETYVLFDTAEAQRVLGVRGGYTDVQVAAVGGVGQRELRDRVAAVLPGGTEAITGRQYTDEQASDVKAGLGFLTTFLLVFAAVALFVGAFIILNTFSILVAQRTRELALLRALGASRAQVTRSVLVEALVVGVIASALGLGLGIGVALGLKALFGAFGAGLPAGPTVIAARTVLASFAVGVVVTAVSALLPARRAARVAPVAALRESATPDRPLRRQTIAGTVVLLVGAGAMALGLTGTGLAVLGLGTLLAFVGIALLSPLLSRPAARVLGAPFTRRIAGRLGRENALRNPRRTAATAAALMVGLALVAAVGVLGSSLNSSIRLVVAGTVGADYVVNTVATGITPQTLDEVRRQPGVSRVDGLRGQSVLVDGDKQEALAVPAAAVGSTIALRRRAGDVSTLAHGRALVSDKLAAAHGWSVGRTVTVGFRSGRTLPLTISGTYADNPLTGGIVMDELAGTGFGRPLFDAGLVKLAAGTDAAVARRELESVLKPYPNVELQDRTQFGRQATDQIDQLVRFLSLLLVLSVLIAVLGIVNTLALSVLERTRELGLLRAVGMSRRQVKRMVRVESVLIAVFGGLLGLAVGVLFGVALQRALVGDGVTELAFPVGQLLVYLVLAGVAGVVAAWLPARRASRLNVLAAIATD